MVVAEFTNVHSRDWRPRPRIPASALVDLRESAPIGAKPVFGDGALRLAQVKSGLREDYRRRPARYPSSDSSALCDLRCCTTYSPAAGKLTTSHATPLSIHATTLNGMRTIFSLASATIVHCASSSAERSPRRRTLEREVGPRQHNQRPLRRAHRPRFSDGTLYWSVRERRRSCATT